MNKKKLPVRLLICALVIVLCGSLLANLFNTNFWGTKVSRISFETANGTLSGLLYMPKGASATDPRPAVIVTHGYLNSAEMQDANAIELSRRGYVVLALDMYDHGHSDINDEIYQNFAAYGAFLSTWAPFWLNSMYDAVQYMYDQAYVLKDEAGNGIIGITGHSMGGFSSTIAVANDERDFATNGYRKIYANLTEGSDFSYSGIFGVNAAAFDAAGGGRYLGKVAAQYDEFFFNAPDDPSGTVRKKDYVSTPDGMTFLQQTEAANANTWYETSDGGHRIIYEPAQTHPWNHFSKTTTANAVEFYTTAFAAFKTGAKELAPTSQIWQLKEAFECVALLGFVLFIIAIALLLIELPVFKMAKTGEVPVLPAAKGSIKVITALILVLAILLPGLFFNGLYDGNATNKDILFWASIAVASIALVLSIVGFKKNGSKILVGGIIAAIAGAGLAVMLKSSLYSGSYWVAPVVNSVAYWTLGCALMALLVVSTVYVAFKVNDGAKLANYGISLKPTAIIGGLLTAVVTVVIGYALLFLVDAIFKTDFRIWTFAFKTFDCNICTAILKYLPTFVLFYIISTISITINTNGLKGVWGYLLAVALNAGGIILWLAYQYITLFSTGVAAYPGAALSGIVLVAMVPTLAIAACISRALYKRTGNIWTPAFINGLLMTIMAVANTTVYYK
ncbi:MAG: alpha/beta hydrolase [Clostridia bacterium]|nr:alpha/beta hydrolase [Clostridia bacterium]